MRIALITDRPKSAISILAVDQQKYSPQHDITICPLHPKRPSASQLRMVDSVARTADVIHVGYWRSGEVAQQYSWWGEKPTLVVMHNPYDLEKRDWKKTYNAVVVKNRAQAEQLPYAWQIPHTVDLERFTWAEETGAPCVGMVCGRIESNKGIAPVARACRELGVRFLLVGRLPGKYMAEVEEAAGKWLDFRQDVTPKELVEAYHEMWVVVVNSKDGFESGPLILLEGMATGTPVLTRNVGMVPDIYNQRNLDVRSGEPDDWGHIQECLGLLLSEPRVRDRLRYAGFYTVKDRTARHSARQYSLLYHTLMGAPLVSVIVPTCNRCETLPQVLDAIEAQTWPHIEVVICDDGSTDRTKQVYQRYRRTSKHTYKYVNTANPPDVYGLAKARNLGVLESEGRYLVFCDDRLRMEPDAVALFVGQLCKQPCQWAWGVKDDAPKGFVENFSAVERDDLVAGGLFNERIEWYGGASQEIRKRFGLQGYIFERVDGAKAYQILGSSGWRKRRDDLVKAKWTLFQMYGGLR